MDNELENTLREFLESFEEVFDRDWSYSKEIMNINTQVEIISNSGTFLNPKVEDETEDWGYRGKLLKEYRNLKKLISNPKVFK